MERTIANAVRWDRSGDPSTGHYESWFIRANAPDDAQAFWMRYTIFAPRGREAAVGETWAIWFDAARARTVASKEVWPIDRCSFSGNTLDVRIAESTLDDARARGRAATDEHTIAWDLEYGGGGAPLLLLPERLYGAALPRAKALVGRPLARFRGSIDVDGERVDIEDWVGSANHNWGSRHTDRYAWGQVAGFDEAPDAFLECSTARLRIGPLWLPRMSPVVLRLGDEELRFDSVLRAMRARGSYEPYRWTIETRGPAGAVRVRIEGDAADFVALRYPNPPGGTKICLNSKLARCQVTVVRPDRPELLLHSRRAAFEILDDVAPPGVVPTV
jgi:hypothetical protein